MKQFTSHFNQTVNLDLQQAAQRSKLPFDSPSFISWNILNILESNIYLYAFIGLASGKKMCTYAMREAAKKWTAGQHKTKEKLRWCFLFAVHDQSTESRSGSYFSICVCRLRQSKGILECLHTKVVSSEL